MFDKSKYDKKYKQENKEKLSTYWKDYYKNNKEKLSLNKKEKRLQKKDCIYKEVCVEYKVCCPCQISNRKLDPKLYASLKKEKEGE